MTNLSNLLSEEQGQQDLFEERNPQEPSQEVLNSSEEKNPQEPSQQLPPHFKNLNKWSLKDIDPLPKMDQILQKVIGPSKTSLIDGFTGHNQVTMDLKDRKKTSFISL